MHEKGSAPGKKDPSLTSSGKVKEAKIMPNTGYPPVAPSNGPPTLGAKSAPLRQSKSFNSSKESILPKPPGSQHEHSKSAKSNGASSKPDASTSVVEGGGKASKLNGAIKSSDAAPAVKPRQISKDYGKLDPKAEALPENRSERVKSPGNGTIVKSSSFKVNAESVKKITKQTSFNTSTQSSLPNGKNLSLSLNADPQKKLPPIKTARTGGAGAKSVSAKNTANLCAECKAELEGAVCFIGNNGRVSACTSRTAVRLCKNLKCANNNPEYVTSLAAAIAAPKKYLISRRHSLNLPRSSTKVSKGVSEKVPAQSSNPNGTTPQTGSDVGAIHPNDGGGEHECEEFEDMQGELEDDVASLEDMGEAIEIDGIASASPQRGRVNGFHRMRRRSFSVVEKQGAEVVTLKKQMMQERKQAEEWMLDYAIEEALHRLAPSKESKVKALVEAFESVIITPKEVEVVAVAAATVAEEDGEPSSSTLRTRFTPMRTPTPTPASDGSKTPKKNSL